MTKEILKEDKMTKEEFLFDLRETVKIIGLSRAEIKETDVKIWDNSINDEDKQEIIRIHSAAKAALAEAKEDLWRLLDILRRAEIMLDEFTEEENQFLYDVFFKYEDEYF